MPYMTIAPHDLTSRSMEYEVKHILIWGSDSTCLGELRKFQSALLPVWNILSVTSINMYLTGYQIWYSSANFLLWFLDILASSGWPKLFHPPSNLSIQRPLTLFIRWSLRCDLLPAIISPCSWSHLLMDGEELDDKWYIWCQGCRSTQFHSIYKIATNAHV